MQDALNSLIGLNSSINSNDVSILLADLKAATDAEAARDIELRLDQMLGVTLDDDERIVLAIKAAAIGSADTALRAPIYAYLDAQALQVAQLSVVPPNVNYSPVLSRIDPTTGVITGTVVFVDRENQPVRVDLVVVRVQGSAFDAIVHVDEQTGAFTFIPVTPPSIPRPSTLTLRVGGVDDSVTDVGATVFEGQLDYTARANVILGPGAGALAGTTISVPFKTRQELAADADRQVAELNDAIDAKQADLDAKLAALNATLLASPGG